MSMDWGVQLCYPVFLSLVCLQASSVYVMPPTNLTLECRNLCNVLKWSYEEPLTPGLKFIVNIGCLANCPENLTVEPPALQADLSFLSLPSEDYYVTVSAVIGENKSELSEGIDFSYFKDSLVSKKCILDLPSVNVTSQKDDFVLLSFEHPWQFHQHKTAGSPKSGSMKKRSHDYELEELPEFMYRVIIMNQKEEPHDFSCVAMVCEEKLPVDAAQKKHCLKITGEMNRISVEATQDYCTLLIEKNYLIYYVVGGVLLLIALITVLFMAYKKMTNPSSYKPAFLNFSGERGRFTSGGVLESVMVAEVEPRSPSLLLPTTDETDVSPVTTPEDNDIRLPLGLGRQLIEDEEMRQDEEVQNNEGSEYAQGGQLEDDTVDCTEFPSAYERRTALVDLAPGELAEGYRG
ncbi:interferon gamma receptor 1-like precursor [Labrus bergylta]|uniref:Interferon gamma receptor 1-like n=1 Tax=Labrus bergylta TaxID=56723 RepID=A0A3Q3G2D2_9LABR|nr:interferon gamma receptor 1-like precursor [Labrus bergylta]